ncbi:MaoC family dehydratase [Rhizobiaceae bacterium]|nr:MaoC family dehydratase [Rhizobiaceae bacterium]
MITQDELKAQVGGDARVSKWFEMSQDKINGFADNTEDWQFIHIDPAAAAKTPFGGTIAHGFLSLSMLSAMSMDCEPAVEGTMMGVNYGFNKVRFVSPVKSGAKIRAHFATKSVEEAGGPGRLLVTKDVTVEIEGETKPAFKAEWLAMLFFGPAK